MENIENLQKIAKIFQPENIITSEEINQVLKGIVEILATYKKGTEEINKDTISTVNTLLDRCAEMIKEIKSEHKDSMEEMYSEYDSKMAEITSILKEIKSIEIKNGEDGKDADEDKIIEEVLSQIKLPEYKETIITGEEIIDKLNDLPLTEENQIDYTRIKNLPTIKGKPIHSPTNISTAVDLDTTARANGYAIVWDSARNRHKYSASGGGGGGTPGGSLGDMQFNDGAGGFGGTEAITTDGTDVAAVDNNFYIEDNLDPTKKAKFQASGITTETTREFVFPNADGTLALKSGLTTNQIAYASDTNTVSSLSTGTYPNLTELSYVKGVTSAIQTQLNAKGAGTVTSVATAGLISGGTITSTGTITTSMATNKLVGRSTAGTGIMEEITIGSGLSLSGGTLTATGGGSGTVTDFIFTDGNGFNGTVTNSTTTPTLSLTTTVTNTQLMYSSSGGVGGISGATSDGAAVTFTTGNLIGADVKASGSGGLSMLSNNGTQTALFGAGGGANNTFYGDIKANYATASTVPYFDASKNLISSAVTPTELGYISGVTSSIQTQLNSKQATGNYITALTGDITASGPGSATSTLATVNSNVGSFGSATAAPAITVNAKGLVTAVTTNTITPAVGSITGLGTGVGTALAVNVGLAGAFVTFNGALGTPSSGTLTNATGLPISGLVSSTSTALGVGSLELGNASDTTLSRSAAGVLAVEGVVIPSVSSTNTLTNKTIRNTVEPGSDDTYTGEDLTGFNATATIAQWDLCYLSTTGWAIADADAASTAGGVMLALAAAAGTNTNPLTVVTRGVVRNDGWTWTTVGAPLYASTTAGALTETAPSGTDDVVRIVGYVMSDDCIFFCPSNDWITRV